jgi:penicillin-insensitive murein endopeptidase
LAFAAELDGNGSSQARGSYARGSLRNAEELEVEGPGYVRLFRSRNRNFGTQDLIELIVSLGKTLIHLHPESERIQVGDLAAIEGGPISGHGSHQNGLDVDLSFFRANRLEQPISDESGFREVFVVGGKLTENFDIPRNWNFFEAAARSGKVQRMFVDGAIKRQYCRWFLAQSRESDLAPEVVATLRRLRPYANHDDHIHIRLYCPASSPDCRVQEEVAPGSGCSEVMRKADSRFKPLESNELLDEHGS